MSIDTTIHNTIDQASDGQHQPKCCSVCVEAREAAKADFSSAMLRIESIQEALQTALDDGTLEVEVATAIAEAGGLELGRTYRVTTTVVASAVVGLELEVDTDVLTEAAQDSLERMPEFKNVELDADLDWGSNTTVDADVTFTLKHTLSVDVEVPVGADFEECVAEAVIESGSLPGAQDYEYEITEVTIDSSELV